MNLYLMNDLIKNEFFYIDSNNLKEVKDALYGYTISLTDNVLKLAPSYGDNILSGQYIKITKDDDEQIFIETDDLSSYYIYYYKNESFWALSNSFFMLLEKLKENNIELTFDKIAIDTLMQSSMRTYNMYDTFVAEVKIVPVFYNIKLTRHTMEFVYKYYDIDTIDIDSPEGMSTIDNWIAKWQNIIYNLVSSGVWTQIDLSGGFDSRTIFSLVYSSGADLSADNVDIFSKNQGNKALLDHWANDFEIATEITEMLGLKVTNKKSPIKQEYFTGEQQYEILKNYYMGVHKEGYYTLKHYEKPTIHFGGINGELVRGDNTYSDDFICKTYLATNPIRNSIEVSMNYIDQMNRLRKTFENDFVAAQVSNIATLCKSHFGMTIYSKLLSNIYSLSPFNDIDLLKIHIPDGYDKKMIYAMIIERTTPILLNIMYTNNRTFGNGVIEKVKEISAKYPLPEKNIQHYEVVIENTNDFVPEEKDNKTGNEVLYDKFVEGKQTFIETMSKLFDRNYAIQLYDYANKYWLDKNSYFGNKWINSCVAVIETTNAIK